MKKTPLRRASKKRAKELATYYVLKKAMLAKRPFCEYPSTNGLPACTNLANDIHHIRGRGRKLNNVLYWLPICAEHHRYLHEHGKEARKLGLLQ